MAQTANNMNARQAALARRKAMSIGGKAALTTANAKAGAQAATSSSASSAPAARTSQPSAFGGNAREASRARRKAMSTGGKATLPQGDRTRSAPATQQVTTQSAVANSSETMPKTDCGCGCGGKGDCTPENTASTNMTNTNVRPPRGRVRAKAVEVSGARSASRARRKAMATRGKAALNSGAMSAAQATRAANPTMSSRDLAKTLREQRSKQGNGGQKSAEASRPMRAPKGKQAGAEDASWKVGVSETAQGQTLTGTMVGRSQQVTGDEPSTCRNVTGTEYMGADIFRQFCQSEPGKSPRKVGKSDTSRGNSVTGNELGRSQRVTGDEPGSCKHVTGNEYVSANSSEAFCGSKPAPGGDKITRSQTQKGKTVSGNNVGRSQRVTGDESGASRHLTGSQYMQRSDKGSAPAKVGSSTTLRGGSMTGTMVGRSGKVTGDEPGSCRNVTGDEYLGQEQYQGFCEKTPTPKDNKVGVSKTLKGEGVTGTMTGRDDKVTGDEPGTCKAITGTPYAGAEQYEAHCRSEDTSMAMARARRPQNNVGASMTGLQPGIGGGMTGDSRGACEPLTGTPYIGADQHAAVCPSTAAEPNSPDFPQQLVASGAGSASANAWGDFSISAPVHAAQTPEVHSAVTGSSYESGHITGSFGKAGGKLTGTEEARFGRAKSEAVPVIPPTIDSVEGRLKSRVTGEGMEAGMKITGDDWDRGDNVTGTEGTSAVRRNPTRRGSNSAMPMQQEPKRNEEAPLPMSKVTGGSGNTEKGALVTYSGGARG